MSVSLGVDIGPLTLKNPIMPASGTFDWFGEEIEALPVGDFGAIVTKSVTLRSQPGNPPQRVAETPSGMLNAIGIPSAGLDAFLEETLPKYEGLDAAVVVSVQAYSAEECHEMASKLSQAGRVDALELNLSCPNLEDGGEIIAQSAELSAGVVAAARSATGLPLIAKLSPNVASISEVAQAVEEAGADALCAINTLRGMAIDSSTRRALLGHRSGGLSGPAIKPVALYMVWECYESVKIPIVGAGGISTTEDVVEFLLAGASAVQVGTATFREPRTMAHILKGLELYLRESGLERPGDLSGYSHRQGLPSGD